MAYAPSPAGTPLADVRFAASWCCGSVKPIPQPLTVVVALPHDRENWAFHVSESQKHCPEACALDAYSPSAPVAPTAAMAANHFHRFIVLSMMWMV